MSRKSLSQLSTAKFSVIRKRNSLNEVELEDGTKIVRKPFFWIPEYGGLVESAPYDNHFIFENDVKKKNFISFQCTCGGMAVVVGNKAYANDMSSTKSGLLLVCYIHQNTGKHADGSS
jgi:hypothetical protein